MSLRQQRQIDLLLDRVAKLEKQNAWMLREMKSGLSDVIERVVRKKIEIDYSQELTTDQKIINALEAER
ncbi:MAG: hypothetical protein DRQ40_03880 [Gammaproteobacteria bacterium]|nr:MAG: hypothetical protein DRQ40_03880 [Gammaproteobacteria bacterium]